MPEDAGSFSSVKERLNEIVDEISSEDISLDDALTLYEEAVKLGLAACDLSEADLSEVENTDEALNDAVSLEPVRESVTDDVPYTGVELG